MKLKPLTIALVAAFVLGCHNTGVVQLSTDTYMISKSSAAGMFVNMPALKAEVIRQANQYAASRGKAIEPLHSQDTFPAHGFPSYEYQFRLVDKKAASADAPAVANPTVGQQLLDLQKAKDSGIITDAEYQTQKTKVLEIK